MWIKAIIYAGDEHSGIKFEIDTDTNEEQDPKEQIESFLDQVEYFMERLDIRGLIHNGDEVELP